MIDRVRHARRLRGGALALSCVLVLLSAQRAAADLRPADPLGTQAPLRSLPPGIVDPTGRDCPVPAAALSLGDAVALALCRSPQTRGTWAAARQQAAALGSAESAWLPSLSASGAESWSDAASTAAGSVIAPGDGYARSVDAALTLSWTLYDFGGREARIRSARRLLAASAATANAVSQQVVLAAVQAYFGVVAAEAAQLAALSAETAARSSLEVARGRREAGVATRADVLQAETAWDQAVLTRVQADGALASARGTLAVTLGAPADTSLKLAPEPVPADVPALEAQVATLMQEASRQRPDLQAAEAQRDSAAADVTAARATGRPSITIGAARNFVEYRGLPNQNYNTVGINVSVPLFSGFNTTYRVRQAEAVLAARDANAEQVRLQVSLDVWNAYAALESAGQQLRAAAALLASAGENEQVARGRYKAGVGTIVDVLTAQSAAALARQQRIGAERGWQVARAGLAIALGRLTGAEPLAHGGPVQ